MQRTTTSSAPPQRAARLRPANPLDAEAIADIHNQYVDSGPYTMESRHWQAIDVKHDLEHFDDRAGFLVAEDTDGTALGWAKIRPYSDREGYRHACEVSTYIDRGSCGQGIGDSLVPEQLKLARRMGYRHATAKVIAGNVSSLRLHLKHGFEIVGLQRSIGIVDGEPADVVILEYLL